MKNAEWIKHIEANRDQLVEAIKAAYRGQLTTSETSGITERVVLWDDGSVRTMESIGGNTYYAAEHDGNALCVATIKGQKPDEWDEWVAEYGDEQKTAEALLQMALNEWDWDPESYIDETIQGLHYSE